MLLVLLLGVLLPNIGFATITSTATLLNSSTASSGTAWVWNVAAGTNGVIWSNGMPGTTTTGGDSATITATINGSSTSVFYLNLGQNLTLGNLTVSQGTTTNFYIGDDTTRPTITWNSGVANTAATCTFANTGGNPLRGGIYANMVLSSSLDIAFTDQCRVSALTGIISGTGALALTYNPLSENSGGVFDFGTAGDAANTYSGGTSITYTGNTVADMVFTPLKALCFGNSGGVAGPLSLTNAELNLNGFSQTVGGLNGGANGSIITNNSSGSGTTILTVDFGASNSANSFSGTIKDGSTAHVGLKVQGAGSQILTASNNYSGGTTINGSILSVTADNNLGASSGTLGFGGGDLLNGGAGTNNFASGRSITLKTGGGTLDTGMAGNTSSFSGSLANGTNMLTLQGSGNGTYSGVISNGSGGVTKSGTGIWVLSNSGNSYSGGTTLAGGTLQLGTGGGLGSTSGSLTVNAGLLDLNGTSLQVGNFTGGGGTVANNGSGTSTFTFGDNSSTNETFAGFIADKTGGGTGNLALTYAGSGVMTLTAANTFSGKTVVSNGTISIANPLALQNSTIGGGNDFGLTFASGITSGTLGGLGGTNQYLLQNADNNPVALCVGNNNANTTYNGALEGGGSLDKIGSGMLTLKGSSTYTGGTIVNAGTLQIGTGSLLALGSSSATLTIHGGLLDLNANNQGVGNFTGTGGTVANNGSGTSILTLGINNAGGGTFSGTIVDNTGAGGSVAVTKVGNSALTLNGNQGYSGATTLSGGTLQFTAANGMSPNSPVTVYAGQLEFGGLNQTTSSAVSLQGGTISGGTLLMNSSFFDLQSGSVSAALSGPAGLTKSTAGTAILSGANTYNGPTTLNAGLLVADNGGTAVTGTGVVTINGGTLSAGPATHVGTLAGLLIAGSGPHVIGPGIGLSSGYGTLNLNGGLTTSSNSTLLFNLGATATNGIYLGDMINVAGLLTIGSSSTISFVTLPSVPGDYRLFGVSSGTLASGTPLSNFLLPAAPGHIYALSSSVDPGYIDFVAALQGPFTWDGNVNGNWDATTANFLSGASGVGGQHGPFVNGYAVTFDDTASSAGTVNLSGAVTPAGVTVNANTASYTFRGPGSIRGATSLTMAGSGTLVLANTNDYSGGTNLNAGALTLAIANALPTAGTISLSGGTLNLAGYAQTAGSVALNSGLISGGTLTQNSGTFTLQSGSVSAVLDGLASLTKSTAGTVTLSGSNTYTGGTTINAGVLAVTADNNLGRSSGTLGFGGGALLNGGTGTTNFTTVRSITLNPGGGTLDTGTAGNTAHFSGSIGNGAYPLTLQGNGNGTYSGAMGSGSGGVTKSGKGMWVLSNSNSYSGGTTVSGGTLQLGNDSALGTGGLTANVGVVDLAGCNPTVTSLSGAAGTIANNGGSLATLTVSQSGTTTFSGTLVDGPTNPLALTKTGTGSLLLVGAGTFSGITKPNDGAIVIGNSLALQNSTVDVDGHDDTLSYASGLTTATLGGLKGTSALLLNNADGNGVNLSVGNNGASTLYSGVLSGSGSLTKIGSGTLTLTGASPYSGGTTVSAGMLLLRNGAALTGPGALTVNGGTLAGAISGGTVSALVQAGSGPHTIAPGAGSASGYGVLNLNGGLNTNANTTLSFSLGAPVSGGTYSGALINLGGSSLTVTGGTIAVNPTITATGDYRLFQGTNFGSPNLGNFTLPAASGDVVSLSTTADNGFIDLVVASAATFSGSATWVSSSGTTWNNNSNWRDGNNQPGVPGVLPRPVNSDTAAFSGAGSVTAISLDQPVSLAALSFSNSNYVLSGGSLTLNSSAGTATVLVASGTQTIASALVLAASTNRFQPDSGSVLNLSGVISGSNSLSLDGAGAMVLGGTANCYTGGTRVDQGTLYVQNSGALFDDSGLTVGAGGTFIFDPTVSGAAAVPASAASAHEVVSPVPEPGTLALLVAGLWSAAICRRFFLRPKDLRVSRPRM